MVRCTRSLRGVLAAGLVTVLLTGLLSGLLIGLPVVPAATVPASAAPAPATVAAAPLPWRGPEGCDFTWPRPLTDMSGFGVVDWNCYYKEWLVRGSVARTVSANALLVAYMDLVRTGYYKLPGDTSCRWDGAVRECTHGIALRAHPVPACFGGQMIARVGPVRQDGRRSASMRIWVGAGC